MWIVWPVIYEAASDAKNTYAPAHSTGWPALPIGVFDPNCGISPFSKLDGISGVHIGPGATAFTLIPLLFFANYVDKDLVNVTRAPLVIE